MDNQDQHVVGTHRTQPNVDNLRETSEASVELREEELLARKRSVESGRVQVGKDIVEEQQSLDVPVTREEAIVERHPVNRRPAEGAVGDDREGIRVPLHEEQVTAEKRAVVYEEVEVGTRAVQETQRVSDTVRKEVVDVDTHGQVNVEGRPSID
ncbi:MAG: hypothetical protein NVSMB2_07380 [Chloroflexota bacterium]